LLFSVLEVIISSYQLFFLPIGYFKFQLVINLNPNFSFFNLNFNFYVLVINHCLLALINGCILCSLRQILRKYCLFLTFHCKIWVLIPLVNCITRQNVLILSDDFAKCSSQEFIQIFCNNISYNLSINTLN